MVQCALNESILQVLNVIKLGVCLYRIVVVVVVVVVSDSYQLSLPVRVFTC
jgi:hypothetical protein